MSSECESWVLNPKKDNHHKNAKKRICFLEKLGSQKFGWGKLSHEMAPVHWQCPVSRIKGAQICLKLCGLL